MTNSLGSGLTLKYNKYYIGLQRDGVADNFLELTPRKKHLIVGFRISRTDELDARLEASGLTQQSYDKQWRRYRILLQPGELKEHADFILDLIRLARELPSVPLGVELEL